MSARPAQWPAAGTAQVQAGTLAGSGRVWAAPASTRACDGDGHGAEVALRVVQVQAVALEQQREVRAREVVGRVPEVERAVGDANAAGDGGKVPGGRVVRAHAQLPVQPPCARGRSGAGGDTGAPSALLRAIEQG